jgi:NAD(P)-dependent dehydrogenase (short-subunit alcohol dehydrogenase family)
VPTPTTILVTGASSGIGRAAAALLADRGHAVYGAARDQGALDDLAESHGVRPVILDVTDPDSIAAVHARIHDETAGAGPDVLVNVAGIAVLGPVEAVPDAYVRRQFDTNVFGTLAVTRAFVPAMRVRRRGRVVNVSSVLGRFTLPGTGVYAAAKYALEAASDALRTELAPFGIAVVLVEPGVVDTPLYKRAETLAAGYADELLPYSRLIPHGVRWPDSLTRSAATPERVAETIAGAATGTNPKARYVPGARNRLNVRLLTALPTGTADRIKSKLMDLVTAATPPGRGAMRGPLDDAGQTY